jgi:hypothetical protein
MSTKPGWRLLPHTGKYHYFRKAHWKGMEALCCTLPLPSGGIVGAREPVDYEMRGQDQCKVCLQVLDGEDVV